MLKKLHYMVLSYHRILFTKDYLKFDKESVINLHSITLKCDPYSKKNIVYIDKILKEINEFYAFNEINKPNELDDIFNEFIKYKDDLLNFIAKKNKKITMMKNLRSFLSHPDSNEELCANKELSRVNKKINKIKNNDLNDLFIIKAYIESYINILNQIELDLSKAISSIKKHEGEDNYLR